MKVEIDAPDFEGFEATGEFRKAEPGEYYHINDEVIKHCSPTTKTVWLHIIYRKVEPPKPEYRVFRKVDDSPRRPKKGEYAREDVADLYLVEHASAWGPTDVYLEVTGTVKVTEIEEGDEDE